MNGNLPLTVTDLLNLIASIVNLSLLIIAIVGIFFNPSSNKTKLPYTENNFF